MTGHYSTQKSFALPLGKKLLEFRCKTSCQKVRVGPGLARPGENLTCCRYEQMVQRNQSRSKKCKCDTYDSKATTSEDIQAFLDKPTFSRRNKTSEKYGTARMYVAAVKGIRRDNHKCSFREFLAL